MIQDKSAPSTPYASHAASSPVLSALREKDSGKNPTITAPFDRQTEKLSIKSIPSISKRKVSNNDFYLLRSLREKSLFRTEISNKRRSIRLYNQSHRGKASSLQEMRGKDRNPPRFLKPAG